MIYICTHTDFVLPKSDLLRGDYRVISDKPLQSTYNNKLIVANNELRDLSYAYAEGYMIRDIFEKSNDEWVGINHYRRYFKDLELNRNTIPIPFNFNMNSQYQECHNINDLLECEKIIDEFFPMFKLDYKKIDILYPCNMFLFNRDIFNRYCDFVFKVLEIFNRQHGFKTDKDVLCYKNGDKYQARLQGFLMERIGTIFFINEFSNKEISKKKIIVTGEKK